MFAKNWHVSECMDYFYEFAHRIFAAHIEQSTSFLNVLHAAVRCLTHGGLYSSAPAESSFKQCFGTNSGLFGHSTAGISGAKYAVTAAKINEIAATVFSNYNLHECIDTDVPEDPNDIEEDPRGQRKLLALTPYRRVVRSDLVEEAKLFQV